MGRSRILGRAPQSQGIELSRIVLIVTLILAGEMVFGLPFHTTRFFRPTFLEVFNLTNTQLGDMFAIYGVTAMLAYFPGGALADRFSARTLVTCSLLATAAGGLYMTSIPGHMQMNWLFAYFGFTTVFLFWGALIKATRDWGGSASQGMAFGLLDGGRGLVAAVVALVGVTLLASLMPADVEMATADERRAAFVAVLMMYTAIVAFVAILAWLLIPVPDDNVPRPLRNPLAGMLAVVGRPVVWAQAGVIISAYCGYKGGDNFSLYAKQVLGMNEVDAARFAIWGAYVRPFAAIAGGLLADRFSAAGSIGVAFALMLVTYLGLAYSGVSGAGLFFVYFNVFISLFAVFALRGIYFALLEDNRTPIHLTGATVGLVSFIGFSPEVFFGPITGRILDANPGAPGFQDYFQFLALIALAGILVTLVLVRVQRKPAAELWPGEIKA